MLGRAGKSIISAPGSPPSAVPEETPADRRQSEPFSRARRQLVRNLTVDTGQRLICDLLEQEGSQAQPHPAEALQTPGMVVSVWGCAPKQHDKFQPCLSTKQMNFGGEVGGMTHPLGVVSRRGQKPEAPNQDDFFVLDRTDSLVFGVLDGHGVEGHLVSHFVQERLPTCLVKNLRDKMEWPAAVDAAFGEVVHLISDELAECADHSGSTVSVAMLDRPSEGGAFRLQSAFLGDSSLLHAWKQSGGDWQWEVVIDGHRPGREDETRRIIDAGGTVRGESGSSTARLVTDVYELGVSRSVGDNHAVPYGLSQQVEVPAEVALETEAAHFILMATDGVWDVISPAFAVRFLSRFSPQAAQLAVERLVKKAESRWQEMSHVADDITAILIYPLAERPRTSSF